MMVWTRLMLVWQQETMILSMFQKSGEHQLRFGSLSHYLQGFYESQVVGNGISAYFFHRQLVTCFSWNGGLGKPNSAGFRESQYEDFLFFWMGWQWPSPRVESNLHHTVFFWGWLNWGQRSYWSWMPTLRKVNDRAILFGVFWLAEFF